MNGAQIDRLCSDWLRDNYGQEMASKYTWLSLAVPMWNPPDLYEALEIMRQALSLAFGPDESFGSIEYNNARMKLGLEQDTPIPEVFIRAFAETRGTGATWR